MTEPNNLPQGVEPNTALEKFPPPSTGYIQEAESRSLNFLNPKLWQAMKIAAETFMSSGALPATIKNGNMLLMILQAGYEAGMQPLEAINSFYPVNGKLSIYGEMAINMVLRAGHKVRWGECNAETATVTITHKDDPDNTMTNTFTMRQAQERKLDAGTNGKKDPWIKHPENMLKFKVFHMTSKFVCPDAFHGAPIKEVLEDDAFMTTTTTQTPEKTTELEKLPGINKRQSLSEALEGSITPQITPEAKEVVKAPKKLTKAEQDAADAKEAEEQNEEEAAKAARLIDQELTGKKLTPAEKMWLSRYQATTKAE